jgi:hypothetical protein
MNLLAPFLKKGDQLGFNNCRRRIIYIYIIFSNILYESLQTYVENIVGTYKCGFKKGNQQSTKFSPWDEFNRRSQSIESARFLC